MKDWRRAGNAQGLFTADMASGHTKAGSPPPISPAAGASPPKPEQPLIAIITASPRKLRQTQSNVTWKTVAAGLAFTTVIAVGTYIEKGKGTSIGDGNGTRELFDSSEIDAIAADRRLTEVYSCGDLTPEELRVYQDISRNAGGDDSSGVANAQMLLLTRASNWFRVAKKVGLTKVEFRRATNFVFAIVTKGTYNPTSDIQHRMLLKEMTGKTLDEY
jgi:hypothetical protein